MKSLGIDYGAKTIGIALSDPGGTLAFPRAEIANDAQAMPFLVQLVAQEGVGQIFVGDTRTGSGAANDVTESAETFMVSLAQATAIPLETIREIGSSIEAGRYAPNGEHNDAAAAAIILQRALDARGSELPDTFPEAA